jgi:hypothetical protein
MIVAIVAIYLVLHLAYKLTFNPSGVNAKTAAISLLLIQIVVVLHEVIRAFGSGAYPK